MTVIMYMDRHWYNTVHVLYMHVCLSENTMFREQLQPVLGPSFGFTELFYGSVSKQRNTCAI